MKIIRHLEGGVPIETKPALVFLEPLSVGKFSRLDLLDLHLFEPVDTLAFFPETVLERLSGN